MKPVLILMAAAALASGCQSRGIPVCAKEDPRFERALQQCKAAHGAITFFYEGSVRDGCIRQLEKKGLHPRNTGPCRSPEVLDYYIRKYDELPPNTILPPGDPRARYVSGRNG
jgi:hypothetical protein